MNENETEDRFQTYMIIFTSGFTTAMGLKTSVAAKMLDAMSSMASHGSSVAAGDGPLGRWAFRLDRVDGIFPCADPATQH